MTAVPDDDELPLLGRLNRRGFRILMVLDVVAIAVLMVGSMVVRFGWDWPTYENSQYVLSFAVFVAIFVVSYYFGGLYEREPRVGGEAVLPRAAVQSLIAGGLVALLNLALTGFLRTGAVSTRVLPFPISNLVVVIVLAAIAVTVNRSLASWLRTRREGPPRVLLTGDADDCELARRHLATNARELLVVGDVHDPGAVLTAVVDERATDLLLVTATWLEGWYPTTVEQLEHSGVTTLMRVTGLETLYGLSRLREVGGLPFVLLQTQTMASHQRHFKRLLDIVLLVVTAPVWIVLLAGVFVYQSVVAGSPLIYRQRRVGLDGSTFDMAKFRTMRLDAEAEGGAQLATVGDDRVIPACRWVRAVRADELPQIFHIITGRMSIVGPRPERPEMTQRFERQIPGYRRRYETPPGLTGLAQIHARYHTDAEYKLGYDLQYLANWSPVLDLEIIARTMWVVLTGRV